jgi:LuxR family maltose regulon positive regulatory protein
MVTEQRCPQCGAVTHPALTEREIAVLRLLAGGLANKEIAARLTISPQTVKNHTHSINQKLGTANRTQAVVVALRLGAIELPSAN